MCARMLLQDRNSGNLGEDEDDDEVQRPRKVVVKVKLLFQGRYYARIAVTMCWGGIHIDKYLQTRSLAWIIKCLFFAVEYIGDLFI